MSRKVRSQKSEVRSLVRNSKFYLLICVLLSWCLCVLVSYSYAQEITILYTGETHAMLYPCNCPKEPDGGIARRAALIKELRKNSPHTLVLDSGGFFAGGLMDEYTQNTELDMGRTRVNLKAMELIQYDAVAIGDDEFNFGGGFLEENIEKIKLTFLSSNIQSEKIAPYIIKEFANTKIGIVGVTTSSAEQKAAGLKFIEPKIAVKQAVEELRKKDVNIIILLSHLGEDEDLRLLEEVAGIDILIVGHGSSPEEPTSKIGSTLILRPSWQGRRLGKLSLVVKDKKIIDYKAEQLRLSDKISDDADALSILPRCFSDANCRKEGLIGICQDPGNLNSHCLFSEPLKSKLLIIVPKSCDICDTEKVVNYLKAQFPGLVTSYLDYPDTKVDKLIKDFGIKTLPAYLLGKEVEKEKGFVALRDNLERKGDFYILKPQFGGISYFLDRKKIKGRLDLFISLYDKNTAELLGVIKEFNPVIHFLALEQQDTFDAAKGNLEVDDYLRSVCVQKYYPENFWDYISCRIKFINSSWWEDCLGKGDAAKIKICARSEEGKSLLKENISLNKELQVMFGPAYLLENQEIFSSQGVPSKEELKKTIKR